MPFITLSNVYLFSNGTCNAPSHSAASTTNGKGGGKAKSDSSGCLISCSEPRTCGQGPGERYGHAACLVKFGRVEKQKRVMFVMGGIDPLSRTTFRDAYQLDLSSLNDAELSHHPLTWSRIQMQPSPRLLPPLAVKDGRERLSVQQEQITTEYGKHEGEGPRWLRRHWRQQRDACPTSSNALARSSSDLVGCSPDLAQAS